MNRSKKLTAMLLMALLALSTAAVAFAPPAGAIEQISEPEPAAVTSVALPSVSASQLDPLLTEESEARPGEKIPVIIMMKEDFRGPMEAARALAMGTQRSLRVSLKQIQAENMKQHWIINAMSAEVPAERIAEIAARAEVCKVWLDTEIKLIEPVVAPLAADYGDAIIGAPALWAKGITGSGIRIAILDTGIDATHPSLDEGRVIAAKDFTDDGTTDDFDGHGTHVAGIAAGSKNPISGVSGVAHGAYLLNAKVFNQYGIACVSWIISAIEWSVVNHADILNLSLGGHQWAGDGSDPLSMAVTNTVNLGHVVVVAAGNCGPGEATINNPATAHGAIAVAASDNVDVIASWSSRGPTGDGRVGVDVAAPGVAIIAPLPTRIDRTGYRVWCGTSMAAPHVSGAIALLLEVHPHLTPNEVKRAIKNPADYLVGFDILEKGAGRLDIYETFNSLKKGILVNHAWSVGRVLPGATINKAFTVINNAITDVTLSIAETVMTDTRGVVAGGWLTTPASVTLPAGASVTFDMTMSVPSGALGTYIGSIRLTSAAPATDIVIPISVNVMQTVEVNAFQSITGTVDEDWDWIYYTLYVQPGVRLLNLALEWNDIGANNLDIWLFNPMGELVAVSDTLNRPETIFIENPEAGKWTVAIHAQSLTISPEIYTLTIRDIILSPTLITVTPDTATVNVNEVQQFTAIVKPIDAYQEVTWSVDNVIIGTIDAAGLFTAHAEGTVTVTATSVVDPNITGIATVIVEDPPVKGDVNRDGKVDTADLAAVAVALNTSPPADHATDLNNDGIVDIFDLVKVGRNFGKGKGP